MKKKLLFATMFIIAACLQSNAQVMEKGTGILNLGIGIGGNYGVYAGGSSIPHLNASFEKGTWEVGGPGVITIGGEVGYKSYSLKSLNWNWSFIGVAARSAYHYTGIKNEKFDPYAGLNIGALIYNGNGYGGSTGFGIGFFLGSRYMFSDKFGVFGEVGGGVANLSILRLGLSIKF